MYSYYTLSTVSDCSPSFKPFTQSRVGILCFLTKGPTQVGSFPYGLVFYTNGTILRISFISFLVLAQHVFEVYPLILVLSFLMLYISSSYELYQNSFVHSSR